MNNDTKKLYGKLINIAGLIYFSSEKPIQCAPKDFTPIFFDFKKLLNHPDIRTKVAFELSKLIDKNVDYICGLGGGGGYYASYIADKLGKPLMFFRRNEKKFKICDNNKRIIGIVPPKKSTIALIDDVFATAITAKEAIEYFKKLNIRCKIYTVFSYGHNKILGQKLNVEIKSLIVYKHLINHAGLAGILNKNDIRLITQHVNKYDKYI